MSISFLPYIKNESSQRFEFPAVCLNNEAYEVNLCNANAHDVLQTLGLPTETEPVAINDFARVLSATLRKHIDRKSPEIRPSEDSQPGKMTIIDMGRRPGYIEEQIFELVMLTVRARQIGATHIGWG
jgi:hypothetical protein